MTEKRYTHKHKQVSIPLHDRHEEVDELLAPLITELNRGNFCHIQSCQGYESTPKSFNAKEYKKLRGNLHAFIQMPTDELQRFLGIVLTDFESTPEGLSLYQRVFPQNGRDHLEFPDLDLEKTWNVTSFINDIGDEEEEINVLSFSFVSFPISDLDYLVEKLKDFNDSDHSCPNCGQEVADEDEYFEDPYEDYDLNDKYPEAMTKIKKAFETLTEQNVFAEPHALDFTSSECQDMILSEMEENPSLKGGVYWNKQIEEIVSNGIPRLALGYVGKRLEVDSKAKDSSEIQIDKMLDENNDYFKKSSLEVAKAAVKALNEAGLETIWNGCICNTIGIVLEEDEDTVISEEIRPCFCEKMWEVDFENMMKEKLG